MTLIVAPSMSKMPPSVSSMDFMNHRFNASALTYTSAGADSK